ncbi:MAG: DUF2672 domain-containing protein [Rickettsia endosymbiont of Ixodes persulcatus]|nr:DUF2672 domain-containing protein [Rickettsia endosymbiont of Ixodes persulcatus]MCZ6903496.1 DUF2672 domain-containing protein [Rickettsia endosymbiont of Ixodes persulcatus]MCZ6908684.1 DUF2672 domain-containing protein [Rickettsia endosymbiont of Ixodes persulcatus]MCZ6909987.1 DUF2672 domain-containing protein [Rickettsia endosymbiont of Ixodes persulcatus]MCZ6913677.1 DUF2672 domain-containing protein [Rickettsia endosymbiont of Ixodes persulcatus]
MSLTQILLILFVGILVTKPSDIFIIIKEFKKIKAYLINIKSSIIKNIDEPLETEQLNFYLKKIINLEGYYHGDYDLMTIKEKYYTLGINNDLIENESATDITEKY